MKLVRKHNYMCGCASYLLILFILTFASCSNDKSDSSDHMGGMNMKKETHSGHDTMKNMEGMNMDDSQMADMDKPDTNSSAYNDSLKIGSLIVPANYRVISSQKSIKPIENTGTNKIKGTGYITVDERRNTKVTARFSGRIEKLYIKYNFEYVNKGDKIMEIYSPEINTYQEELLLLLKDNNDSNLINKAEEKLRLLGVNQTQINNIKKSGNAQLTMTIYSPRGGYVFFKSFTTGSMNNFDNKNSSKMAGMGNGSSSFKNAVSENGQIREGGYVNKGDILFWLNDLNEVWAMIAVDNTNEQELKINSEISLISELYENDTVHAKINFIEPTYQQNQKFIMSRVYMKNPNQKYKINSLLAASISVTSRPIILIPYSSVLFLGKRKIVWVLKEKTSDNNKIYEARDVIIGGVYDDMVEIKSGLKRDEEIATEAGYLLDRESLIKPE